MLQDIWTPDVKANQLASVLAGIAPIRSVVNVGSGMADLVLLPIDQYRKDGRVLRGLQKGATSFSKSSALEALRLGARLATGTQVILEKAESIIGARIGSTLNLEAVGPDARRSRYASQPKTAAAGLKGAYEDLGDNLRTTAQTILAVPMEVYERSATDVDASSHYLPCADNDVGVCQGCTSSDTRRYPTSCYRSFQRCQQDFDGLNQPARSF